MRTGWYQAVGVSASVSFLKFFDTGAWMTGRTSGHPVEMCAPILAVSFLEHLEEEDKGADNPA